MCSHSFLVVGDPETSDVSKALRDAFPTAVVTHCPDPAQAVAQASDYKVVVVRAESNAGFTRVRHLRRAYPNIGIVVTASDRDRSSAAYVAGANEFALSDDRPKIVKAVQDVLAYAVAASTPGATPAPAPAATPPAPPPA
jgi:DNA-binding NarL/FixJ family response regulator